MKIGFNWATMVKVGIIVAALVIAPYFMPFALEFVLLADFMGLEALIVFLAISGKSMWRHLAFRFKALAQHIAETAILVAELYLFTPRVYLSHATASSLCLVLASSLILCCAVWIPPIIMSSQLII